jgi:hypothetical protein
MTVDWDGYSPYIPEFPVEPRPLHEAPRREARAAFKQLMAAKDERIAELGRLLRRNGIELRSSDEGLQEVNDWFRTEVESDPQNPGRLRPLWYAVVNDLALYLGDVCIDRCPNLEWVMFTQGAKAAAYQRHVIMGFKGVSNPRYNFDVDLNLATYGHRIIGGQDVEPDAFVRWVSSAEEDA